MTVTIITGAGGGMGLACLELLRSEPLLLVDIQRSALDTAVGLAPHAETYVADLGSLDELKGLVRRVEDLGGLGSLIHLAGVSPTMGDVDRILQVDLAGTAALIEGLTPTLHSGGVAVCVASIAAHLFPSSEEVDAELDKPLDPDLRRRLEETSGAPLEPGMAYSLAKRGVVRLCERAGIQWGTRGGRVVSVSPGLIDTPMGQRELRDNPGKRRLVGRTPVSAPADGGSQDLPGRTLDIARTIEFLVSPEARFINACDIRVDGGLVPTFTHSPVAGLAIE